jgi:hypothetical protein
MRRIAGYTNHWVYLSNPANPAGGFTDAQWNTIVRETRRIIAKATAQGIVIAGPNGMGAPIVNAERIILNGDANANLEHEDFVLIKAPSEEDRRFHLQFQRTIGVNSSDEIARGFCKTNRKPYDGVVASILAVAKRVGKDVFDASTDEGRVKRVFANAEEQGTFKSAATRIAGRYVEASTSKHPSVARQVEEDYKRKAITRGERDELLEAIDFADSRREAEKLIEQARKNRTAAASTFRPAKTVDVRWTVSGVPGSKNEVFESKRNVPVEQLTRVAATTRVAYEPPFHNAALADDALGDAYRALIDLKFGIDSWHEIPSSAHPLYKQIMDAVAAIVTARKITTQVREMVARKRY